MKKMKTNWPTKKLGDVCVINPKKSEVSGLADDTVVSFVPMSSVDEFSQSITNQEDKNISEVRKGYTYFKKGDVLFAKITPCMENGKVTHAKNLKHDVGFGSTEFHVIRAGKEVLPEYVYSLVSSSAFRLEAERKMTGSAGQKRVPKDFIEKYEIVVPPIEEQKRIVDILEDRIGKVKEAVKLRQDTIADTEKILSVKLTEIFDAENSWEERSFSDKTLLKMTSGGTPSRGNKSYYQGNIPWLKSGELKDNRNIVDSEEKISEEAIKKSSAKLFPVGSVLFAMYGATAGKIGILGIESSTNQAVAVMIPNEDVLNNQFLYYFLMKKRNEIIEMAWGGAQPNLSQTILKQFSIPLPDLHTQVKMVKELDVLSARVAELRALQESQLTDLKSLERAYLHEAFNGELV